MVGRDPNFLEGRNRVYFLDRDPLSVAAHQKIPVATSTGSRSPTLKITIVTYFLVRVLDGPNFS